MRPIEILTRRCEELVTASRVHLKKTRTVPKDVLLNILLCLIDSINRIDYSSCCGWSGDKEWYLKRCWAAYLQLQGDTAPERTVVDATELVSFDEMQELGIDAYKDDGVVEFTHPSMHSGGLGYAHVNLTNVGYAKGKKPDPYWRPPKKPMPVKHYTKEELESGRY